MLERYIPASMKVKCAHCTETSVVTIKSKVCSSCATPFPMDIEKLFNDCAQINFQHDMSFGDACFPALAIVVLISMLIWGPESLLVILFFLPATLPVLVIGLLVGWAYATYAKHFRIRPKFPEFSSYLKERVVIL